MAFQRGTSDFKAQQKLINDDIRLGVFKPAYLVYGDESYLRLQNRNKLRSALTALAGDMNLLTAKGAESDPEELISFAETMPFFSEKRVIFVEDSGFFKAGGGALEDYLKTPSKTAVFVFTETAVDKNRAMFRRVTERGRVIRCDTQPEETLKLWIAKRLKDEGKDIRPAALQYFLERTGNDMSRIAGEMEKLIAYTGDRSEVTGKDIDAVCAGFLNGVIFDLTNAIAEKNREKAIRGYMTMLAMEEPPARILFHLTKQFELLLKVSEMRRMNAGMDTMVRVTGRKEYIVSKYIRLSRQFTEAELKRLLELCASNDCAVKNGLLDKTIAIEMVVAEATS